MEILEYDPSNAIGARGVDPADLSAIGARLLEARSEVLEDDLALFRDPATVPAAKQPLDAGFIELPERLLRDHREHPVASEVGRILAAAERLAAEVDRCVVLGIGGSYMGARALFEACCHPYHNELPREARAGRPRIYLEGFNVDNDSLQGLVQLLGSANGPSSDWALVAVSKSGGTLEPALATQVLLGRLREACRHDPARLRRLFIPVTGPSGRLRDIANDIGCDDVFEVPEGVGGRYSVLSAVGLLPAAILGLDVVSLLAGAARMNEHFRTAPPGENAVLDYVAICHLMSKTRGATIRVLSVWSQRLEALGLWYDQLLSESLGKREQGATPITVVNTRDLHSRGQQHQDGPRDKMITNVIVKEPRALPLELEFELGVGPSAVSVKKTFPQVMLAAARGTNESYREDQRPTASIHIPRVDEFYLGQLFQMLMLATAVEGRLIGINPYGQPGVEGYKTRMTELLTSTATDQEEGD